MFMSIFLKFLFLHDIQLSIFGWNLIHWDSEKLLQSIVHELLRLIQENSTSVSLDKPYINVLIDTYSSNYIKNMTDNKYGEGASDYIVKAFHYYSENNASENN